MLRCVATCWMMLDQIWKRSNFSCNILDVAWFCTRLATFTQHCCARACALGPLAIATRQRNDGFLSVTMADNTAQIQQPKKEMSEEVDRRRDHVLDRSEERPCLWNIVEMSYHSRETSEKGFEELKCLLFHHPQEVIPMKKLQFDDADIDITQSPPYWFLVHVRVRQRPGAYKQRHVVINVACVWPARSITFATSCNNVARCCVEMLRAFGQALTVFPCQPNLPPYSRPDSN